MNYLGIDTASMSDGKGVRVVLWVAGCPHHCEGCHNPESWDETNGQEFTNGTLVTLIEALNKPYIQGLTFSGGDPLAPCNRDKVKEIAREIKTRLPDKDIWLYTGYYFKEVKNLPAMDYIDYVVDGPFEIEHRDITLPFRGSPNQNIIKVNHG